MRPSVVLRVFSFLMLIAPILLVSCSSTSSKELTRGKVLSLLNNGPALHPVEVKVTKDAYELAEREGVYIDVDIGVRLTPKGRGYFDQYSYSGALGSGDATLKTPLKREAVEVTGITDAPMQTGANLAKLKWDYADAPDVINRYIGTTGVGHEGVALLKLYDDAWRIEEVQTH